MESNNNNNELREELTQLQNKVTRISNNTKDAITSLKCEVWKCNGNEPILIDGKLPNPSRIGQLENKLKELEEGLEEVRILRRSRSTDIETNKTRSNGNRNRIANLESWRQRLGDGFVPPVEEGDDGPGAGGGKRRKRTRGKLRAKSRAKSRKKRRKSRRKSKGRKRRRKNLKKRTKKRRR